jgi:hypothetical protein
MEKAYKPNANRLEPLIFGTRVLSEANITSWETSALIDNLIRLFPNRTLTINVPRHDNNAIDGL